MQKTRKANFPGFSLLLILVRLAGIEPTTPWFVAKYSIQLSYSREACDYRLKITRYFKKLFFY